MSPYKNAFITGASSGIGKALCLELARRGTHVVAAARREGHLVELVKEIRSSGGCADGCVLDVRDHGRLRSALHEWDERVNGFDLVIANAGVGSALPGDALTWEQVENVVAVNFTAALATLVEGKQLMLPRGHGTLAATSSLAGLRGMPGSGAYSATKAGLQSFLESMELDLQGTGLRVIDTQPGFVRSEMTDKNKFPMPFLWEVERAAKVCVEGLERGKPVIHFPWQMSWSLRVARVLPRWLWRRLATAAKPEL